jgi:hypothetical protein
LFEGNPIGELGAVGCGCSSGSSEQLQVVGELANVVVVGVVVRLGLEGGELLEESGRGEIAGCF